MSKRTHIAVLIALALGTGSAASWAQVDPIGLSIDSVYINQSTQNYQRNVPLVANRRGLLRLFVVADRANTYKPDVSVRFYYNHVLDDSKTVVLHANASSSGVPGSVQEDDYKASYNYQVPASWIKPGLEIVAEVDPQHQIPVKDAGARYWPKNFGNSGAWVDEKVSNAPSFDVSLIPVHVNPTNKTGNVTAGNLEGFVEYLRRIHPVPEQLKAEVHAVYNTDADPDSAPGYGPNWNKLLSEINALQRAEAHKGQHYYGVINGNSGGTGLGYIGGFAAIGIDWNTVMSNNPYGLTWRSGTFAHEVGHNFGLQHTPCGNPAGVDPNYPYAGAIIGALGYDSWNAVAHPRKDTDVMAYCGYQWTSDYDYKKALNWRLANDGHGVAAGTALLASGASEGDMIMVWGHSENGRLILEPALRVTGQPTPESPSGDVTIQTVDAAGVTTAHHFQTTPLDHSDEKVFSFLIPIDTPRASRRTASTSSATNGVKEIRLLESGNVVARHTSWIASTPNAQARSANAPAVSAELLRQGDRAVLHWDVASFPLALIRDAATGQVVAISRNGSASIGLPSGAGVEVEFSDGVNTVTQHLDIRS